MAAAAPPTWPRRFPRRAVRRLSWYVVGSASVAAVSWLLFGTEPDRLESGEPNPLALVPPVTVALLAAGSLPLLLAVVRRPQVGADHYALRVRPGSLRTLLLPWTTVAELAATASGEPLLLIRCRPARQHPGGDEPRWYDRGVLRTAGSAGARYHLAVRLDEFAGDPEQLLDSLAAYAPQQVIIHFR